MLSNAYLLAKFRFDTAENEPAKKLLILLICGPREFPLREPALGKVGVHAGHAAAADAGFRAADAGSRDGRVAEVCSRIEV
jgi:hypothetical protein